MKEVSDGPAPYLPLLSIVLNPCPPSDGGTPAYSFFNFNQYVSFATPPQFFQVTEKFNILMTLRMCKTDADCEGTGGNCWDYDADPDLTCLTPFANYGCGYILNGWNGAYSPDTCGPSPTGCSSRSSMKEAIT